MPAGLSGLTFFVTIDPRPRAKSRCSSGKTLSSLQVDTFAHWSCLAQLSLSGPAGQVAGVSIYLLVADLQEAAAVGGSGKSH